MEHIPLLLVSSISSGVASRLLLHPFDTLRTHQQMHKGPGKIRNLSRRVLYAGMFSSLILTGICNLPYLVPAQSSYLITYTLAKGENAQDDGPLLHLKAAAAAELVSSAFWTPLDVIKNHSQYYGRSMSETIRAIYKVNGHCSFYHGYALSLATYLPFSFVFFTTYEKLKSILHERTRSSLLPAYGYAGCASIAAALAVVATNPVDLIKTRKQIGLVSGETGGIINILRKEGWSSLYKGMGPRMMFYIPSTALQFMVFEVMYHWWDVEERDTTTAYGWEVNDANISNIK
jgi:hypothetical protein